MLELRNICKTYDTKKNVVENLNLTVNDGEFIVLIGESGCGKTTTMQIINRLVEPTSGSVFINGKNIKAVNKNELRRNIGYVIQDIGLFPHKTIEENVATVPILCKKEKDKIKEKVKQLMDVVGLPYDVYAKRYPRELSGGQQQRIGVARALANDSDIILMDEPFSALDPITREQLQDELLRLHNELGVTIVFVTHDIDEAIKLGDKIAVMQKGKIVQFDSPEEILKNPANDFVEDFIGKNRLWKTPDFLKAEDVMNDQMVKVDPNCSVEQAIEIMIKHNTAVLAIVDQIKMSSRRLIGLVDAKRFRGVIDNTIKIKDVMNPDLIKIPFDMPLTEVISLREKNNILYSPVVDVNGNFVGVITNTSILNVLSQIMPGKEEC